MGRGSYRHLREMAERTARTRPIAFFDLPNVQYVTKDFMRLHSTQYVMGASITPTRISLHAQSADGAFLSNDTALMASSSGALTTRSPGVRARFHPDEGSSGEAVS